MNTYLMGIDIGTSACKIAIFNAETGGVVAQDNQAYQVYYPQENWAEQNPDEWWTAVKLGIKNCLNLANLSGKDIYAIGVDGQSWSTIPIDRELNVLSNTPIWFDTRSEKQVVDLREKFGDDEAFRVNGNIFRSTHMTPKYLWFKQERPNIYRDAWKFLSSNAFIVLRLTDKATSDYSQNYGVHFFDTKTMEYREDLAKLAGIELDKLPEAFACHQVVGHVTKRAAEETGLFEGTPVVAGGLDAATGTLGCGILEPGQTQIQGGQAGGMSICEDKPLSSKALIFGPHVVPDRWLLQGGTVGGGGVMRWLKEEFMDDLSFDQITELAKKAPAGSDGVLFFPYLAGERSPIWNPNAKGISYGLSFDKSKEHVVRSALEGVVYSVMHNFDYALKEGITMDELDIRAMGGIANSEFWIQIFCDVLNKPISIASSDTATSLGTAVLAGVGSGVYSDFSVVKNLVKTTRMQYPMKENIEVYKKYFEDYRKLSEVFNKIF